MTGDSELEGLEALVANARPTAKRLILSVLSQPNLSCLPISQLISWGALFDQSASAIRVTTSRLVKDRLLEKTGRGMYMIGPQGMALKSKAGEWIDVLDQVRPWNGGWLSVYTGHLGKTDRRNVRLYQRAFRLLGFKELVDGLWIRPDNLIRQPDQIHHQLCQLGLDPGAVMLRSDRLSQNRLEDPLVLWPQAELNAAYDHLIACLAQSQARLDGRSLRDVTRETFIVGEHIIRQINADPLLPDGSIDAAKRRVLIEAMKAYSDFSHPFWVAFLDVGDS